jgi:TolB-like protein/DNA-binding winged helix-turn-helix (wHTH) protein
METTPPLTPPLDRVFRFGPFEINLRTGELRKRGIRLVLQEQPLKILIALLEQPGELVSRTDLCRRLWPQGTFVDFEHSLNAAVRRLRTTLGDDAETPKFIETVHRRGYRFLAWGELSAARADSTGPRLSVVEPVSSTSRCSDALQHRTPRFGPAAGEGRPPGASVRARLAVLPFTSFDVEHRESRLIEGLMDETIVQMARHCPAHVGVIARTSVMHLATAEQSATQAACTLAADYVLEGSIWYGGDRVRIIAQLIESREETHIWAATYDRVIVDALAVQVEVADEIARAVAAALSARRPRSREAAS